MFGPDQPLLDRQPSTTIASSFVPTASNVNSNVSSGSVNYDLQSNTAFNYFNMYPGYGTSSWPTMPVTNSVGTTLASTTTASTAAVNPYISQYVSHYPSPSIQSIQYSSYVVANASQPIANYIYPAIHPTTSIAGAAAPVQYYPISTTASGTNYPTPVASQTVMPPQQQQHNNNINKRQDHGQLPHSSKKLKTNNDGNKDSTPFNAQDFYCETCKIICVGSHSYMKHVGGNRHKKRLKQSSIKVAQKKNDAGPGSSSVSAVDQTSDDSVKINHASLINEPKKCITLMNILLNCRVCDAPCVSVDSYASHIAGSRHNKAVALKKKLNESIPSNIPEILSPNVPKLLELKIESLFGADEMKKDPKDPKNEDDKKSGCSLQEKLVKSTTESKTLTFAEESDDEISGNVKPIGQDFIEEVLNQNGKLVCFTCTLCECRFNDANAKNLHLKGKRHRLQYKRKVDPSVMVEFIQKDKRKIEKEKIQKERASLGEKSLSSLRESVQMDNHYTKDLDPFESSVTAQMFLSLVNYKAQTTKAQFDYSRCFSDYLIEYRHQTICPAKPELDYIYQTTYLIDKSIRSIGKFFEANFLTSIPLPKLSFINKKILDFETILSKFKDNANEISNTDDAHVDFIRVVRPCSLGQGILLSGERHFEMIILCSILPTRTLLRLFSICLPEEISKLAQNKPGNYFAYVETLTNEGMLKLTIDNGADSDKILHYNIYLTCPSMRKASKEVFKKEAPDLLNYDRCIGSLQKVRRYRWFKEKSQKYMHFSQITKILRDLAKRVDVWSKIKLYSIQVILERILVSANCTLSPSALFRHFFEFIAHGIIMRKGVGLLDPCEDNLEDIFEYLTPQDREDLTSSAQHTLRLIALRQLNKVLNIDENEVYRIRMSELGAAETRQLQLKMRNDFNQKTASLTGPAYGDGTSLKSGETKKTIGSEDQSDNDHHPDGSDFAYNNDENASDDHDESVEEDNDESNCSESNSEYQMI